MTDSVNPEDFKAFTRPQALIALRDCAVEYEIDASDAEIAFASLDNDELEAELCLSGIVHDSIMVGVFDNDVAASFALLKARSEYQES